MICRLVVFVSAGMLASASVHQKRGFVADGNPTSPRTCDDPKVLNGSAWMYDYNAQSPYAGCSDTYLDRFTAMSWCNHNNLTVLPGTNLDYFLGFNEPNDVHECNLSPADAARDWKVIMDTFPLSQLVSPATAGDGLEWYAQFFGNCSEMYGNSDCRVSYIATHDYSCNASSTLDYIHQLYSTYGKQVWLTEFACGDHNAKNPLSDQITFMKDIVPRMDADDAVFRYAWMSARQEPGDFRMLLETVPGQPAKLTELGELYNTL